MQGAIGVMHVGQRLAKSWLHGRMIPVSGRTGRIVDGGMVCRDSREAGSSVLERACLANLLQPSLPTWQAGTTRSEAGARASESDYRSTP